MKGPWALLAFAWLAAGCVDLSRPPELALCPTDDCPDAAASAGAPDGQSPPRPDTFAGDVAPQVSNDASFDGRDVDVPNEGVLADTRAAGDVPVIQDAAADRRSVDSAADSAPLTPDVGTIVLSPIADAYVRDDMSGDVNFGTAPILVVKSSTSAGNSRISYLKFPLRMVGNTVASARLRLFGSRPNGSSITDSAYGLTTDSWTEM